MNVLKSLYTPAVAAALKALLAALIGAVLERAISILDAFNVGPTPW